MPIPAGVEAEDPSRRDGSWLIARGVYGYYSGVLDDVGIVIPAMKEVYAASKYGDREQTPKPHCQDVERHKRHDAGSVLERVPLLRARMKCLGATESSNLEQ